MNTPEVIKIDEVEYIRKYLVSVPDGDGHGYGPG